ncbi:ArsR/SmtB family transcription factor [Pseudonocardia asaccharolytica]|uniref:ArsR family transcriptional regulator n=1 Tax=Pseudonocardia asaccharolytica DSM 44247 = NBRC 16224 TaxID=1123024 RepID=A0A511D1T7_9PSEU|nr:metalloregulator ArsR/SmtB family transcription factor [Pseudonocardia asaccharolytica]GEL18741.1 ArsR family transcriptional regulator [Pseudonocardia asaccharolytica DSM 44247 = NBRC 16224]
MGDALLKAELFEQLARVGKALGSGKRLELLDLLSQGPRSVADLAATAGLGLTTASMHLKTLREAGLVATTRKGTTIRYRLAGEDVAALFAQLRAVAAAHLADVDVARTRYLRTQDGEDTEQIGRDELLRRAQAGEAVVLDVRPVPEFAAGHIPGAVSIPLDELPDRLSELPADVEIVAYCRGAYCVLAHDAVRLLTAHGRRAVRLAEGMLEWRLANQPVTATAS